MSNPSCYYPPHVISCYATMPLCWTSFNDIEPAYQSPTMVIDHNHAFTPIQCDDPVHMKCNAPLHVISYYIYHECYMDNSNHTIYHVLWTIISKAYNFQIKPISMSISINTHISTFNYSQACHSNSSNDNLDPQDQLWHGYAHKIVNTMATRQAINRLERGHATIHNDHIIMTTTRYKTVPNLVQRLSITRP